MVAIVPACICIFSVAELCNPWKWSFDNLFDPGGVSVHWRQPHLQLNLATEHGFEAHDECGCQNSSTASYLLWMRREWDIHSGQLRVSSILCTHACMWDCPSVTLQWVNQVQLTIVLFQTFKTILLKHPTKLRWHDIWCISLNFHLEKWARANKSKYNFD